MDKSTRKFKKCHATSISAGIKEKVTNHCPPDMTDSVKKALEKEIADFDAAKTRQDIEEGSDGGPSVNAYHDWLMGGQELPEANPDVLSEDDGLKYIASKKDHETVRLLKEFRQALTKRELQVWNLIMTRQYSYREAAKLLNIDDSTLRTYLSRAKLKFTKYAEAIKRVEKE